MTTMFAITNNMRRFVDVRQMGRLMAMAQNAQNGRSGVLTDGTTQSAPNRPENAYSVLRSETSVGANRCT